MDMFAYNPAAIPDYVHTVANSSAQLEDIRSQAQPHSQACAKSSRAAVVCRSNKRR